MQRKVKEETSEFVLKNAIEYEVSAGYNVYSSDYNISQDRLSDEGWSAETPLYYGESDTLRFYWYNLDSATGLLSSAVAAIVLLNAF